MANPVASSDVRVSSYSGNLCASFAWFLFEESSYREITSTASTFTAHVYRLSDKTAFVIDWREMQHLAP